MTAVTTVASGIAFGAYDVAIAGGVEHMSHHPMGEGLDPNPRIVAEKLVDESALVMGSTAENLHDRFPELTRQRADAFAATSQDRVQRAYQAGVIQESLVPVATEARNSAGVWRLRTNRRDRGPPSMSSRAPYSVPPARSSDCWQRGRSQRRCHGLPRRGRVGS